ncbi:hypothetical protein EB74_11615 [Mycobacterium sp. SWH-M5]|uniref:hypothetical protein n=1 Tax=Mycolicibacterium goodii TaxID=134601 RepID=UPI00093CAE2D|nr:hypothetical protein [Mycolicibacterium goodii]MBU8817562.1 hypothetical protein [Mycolicibacterium goodii]OKH63960.1 hypothetical protein EB74_11615 [Mycobacterium sp. SWH-M5]
MTDDERSEGAETPHRVRVNPLGAGDIKLTLPGRSRPSGGAVPDRSTSPGSTPSGAVDDDEPPAQDDAVVQAAEADATTEVAAVDESPLAEPDRGEGETKDGEADSEWEYAEFDSAPAPRRADRKVLQVFAGVIAVVALLAGVVWWYSRPADTDKPVGRPAALPVGGANTPAAPTSPVLEDGPLPITLNAECPGQTDPKLAASTDPRSAWVCPTGGVPFGQKLVATMAKPNVITGIKFWPGFQGKGPDGGDEWFRHRVIQEAQLVCNDPERTPVMLRPMGQRHEYSQPLNRLLCSAVEITVLSTEPPPPAPRITPTAAPPGSDPDATGDEPVPDLGSLFPPADPDVQKANDPDSSSIAVWGFQLIGHPVP